MQLAAYRRVVVRPRRIRIAAPGPRSAPRNSPRSMGPSASRRGSSFPADHLACGLVSMPRPSGSERTRPCASNDRTNGSWTRVKSHSGPAQLISHVGGDVARLAAAARRVFRWPSAIPKCNASIRPARIASFPSLMAPHSAERALYPSPHRRRNLWGYSHGRGELNRHTTHVVVSRPADFRERCSVHVQTESGRPLGPISDSVDVAVRR
jgi:hypothetical protein